MSTPLGEATRNDFRTDVGPTLFVDNWGRDVVSTHPDKIRGPIDTAIALAQLMSSIRTGTPVDPDVLDCEALDGVAFFDGSDGRNDHFFAVELHPRYTGGSYKGPRVSASFSTGYVRLSSRRGSGATYGTSEERWSTRRGDVIVERPLDRFVRDHNRLANAVSILEESPDAELTTERPATWPGTVFDQAAYRAGIRVLGITAQPVYLGDLPSQEAIREPARRIHIPFLDN